MNLFFRTESPLTVNYSFNEIGPKEFSTGKEMGTRRNPDH
jgi:hypothetical protein